MGFNFYETEKSVIINSKQLFYFLREFRKEKFIPLWIKQLDKSLLIYLFDTLMKGDGNKNRTKFTTKYKKLADDFLELLIKIGKSGKIRFDGQVYRISIRNKFFNPVIGNNRNKKLFVRKINYNGYIYDVTVPNHIILVRRNGKIIWSGNCYGPRQDCSDYGAVIPIFIRRVLNRKPPIIYGNGKQTRSFLYISDCIRACLLTMNFEGVFNIGSEIETTIEDLAYLTLKIAKLKLKPIYASYKDFYGKSYEDIRRRVPNIDKLKKLGFQPQIDLKKGLKLTYKWFKKKEI
jgi:TATA-box binding protein (TBP) (component of TFIID and TFIIIB)